MTSPNFNTENNTLRKLIGNGVKFQVPRFQRDYSWGTNEWDDLWQDIEELASPTDQASQHHYMGYLVLQSHDSRTFNVIDGQQRLTTLSILILAAIRGIREAPGSAEEKDANQRRAARLFESYIGFQDPVSLQSQTKLSLNRHNDDFYRDYIVPLEKIPKRNLHHSNHQLRKALDWHFEKIRERFNEQGSHTGVAIAEFVDKVLVDGLFFTVITVTDELNAFKVFETLNARGVQLSSTDLLKNHLFSVVSAEGDHFSDLEDLERRWERIVTTLGSARFSDYLRAYWNSRYREVRKTELFKVVRSAVTDRASVFRLLRTLDANVETYVALGSAHDPRWSDEEAGWIRLLKLFGVRLPIPMLMCSYERFAEDNRPLFTKMLRAVTMLTFRYNVICSRLPGEQGGVFNRLAIGISSEQVSDWDTIRPELMTLYPTDEEFTAAFRKKSLRTTIGRNRQIVRHILFAIEQKQNGKVLDERSDAYSIEHILPESPEQDAWPEYEEHRDGELRYRLGNMAILETKANRDLGNKAYAEKREVFREAEAETTRAIAKHNDCWDGSRIDARQSRLAKVAKSIWEIG